MSSKSLKFTVFLIEILFVDNLFKMVEPVLITVVAAIAAGCTAAGFLARYFYDKASEEPKVSTEENKMGNVIVTNIKEAVEVEDHDHVVFGLYIIVGLLVLMITIYVIQKYIRAVERRTLRRALGNNNALETVTSH